MLSLSLSLSLPRVCNPRRRSMDVSAINASVCTVSSTREDPDWNAQGGFLSFGTASAVLSSGKLLHYMYGC